MLAGVAVLDFDESAAHVFSSLVSRLLIKGTPIGDMDAQIASVAIVHGHTLVTRNLRHFQHVKALKVRAC
jgi:predicted nucleic acid-binding protein